MYVKEQVRICGQSLIKLENPYIVLMEDTSNTSVFSCSSHEEKE